MQTFNADFKTVATSSLRPDPDQPRRSIRSEDVRELAESIRETGLINPIEVDPTGTIITGELRWRAAKEAGLTEIPVRELELKPTERLVRQLAENLHQHTMAPMDTARAIKKLLAGQKTRPTDIARQIGKTDSFVKDMLMLAGETPRVKQAIESGGVDYTAIREANRFPEPLREEAKEKVLSGEFRNRDTVRALRQAIVQDPEATEELMEQTYNKSHADNMGKIRTIAPTPLDRYNTSSEKARVVYNTANHLLRALKGVQYLQAPPLLQPGLKMVLEEVQEKTKEWLDTSQYE